MNIGQTLPACRILLQAEIRFGKCLLICRENVAGLFLMKMPSQSHWAVGTCLRSVRYCCSLQNRDNAARLFPILMTYMEPAENAGLDLISSHAAIRQLVLPLTGLTSSILSSREPDSSSFSMNT